MAKFPQFEWMEIDGRMVPSIKPQHYKKGSTTETQLTGHDNPLPVANYTQNDNGVWLPTSKDNPVPTQLTGSKIENVIPRNVYRGLVETDTALETPQWANRLIVEMRVYGITGTDVGIRLFSILKGLINLDMLTLSHDNITSPVRVFLVFGENSELGDLKPLAGRQIKSTPFKPTPFTRTYVEIYGEIGSGEGVDLEVNYIWQN